MIVFRPKLALFYVVAFAILALVTNRFTVTPNTALATEKNSEATTIVEVSK